MNDQLSQDETDNNYEVPQENVEPRRRHKPIGHKWIFKKKLRPDGTIEKYKARLVAKGHRQKEGQDFCDTYLPVTRITSIRTLIAIAAIHNLIIHQMDVKTAFLYGELDEEIYMKQPEWFLVYKYNIEDISNNTIIESAKADFFENIFPYKDKEKQILNQRKKVMNDQLSQDETDNNYEVPQENVEPRRSKRAKVNKDCGPDYMM
nr:retrotransposon protein, putative, Ty1-copia subclass [Tanacetum cinerariifolium]